jgi:hypothetical protein
VEKRARIHWEDPKRPASSSRPSQGATRRASRAARSYRLLPKRGEVRRASLARTRRASHEAQVIHRENPKRSGVAELASWRCRRWPTHAARIHRKIPKRFHRSRWIHRENPKDRQRNRSTPLQIRPALLRIPIRHGDRQAAPRRDKPRCSVNAEILREIPMRPDASPSAWTMARVTGGSSAPTFRRIPIRLSSFRLRRCPSHARRERSALDTSGITDVIPHRTPPMRHRTPSRVSKNNEDFG